MARLFLMIVMLVATHSAFARSEFKSQEDFSHWLTFYYEHPEPDRIPDAVKYMSQSGVLDNNNAISPIFGFLSGVFRGNPESINPWLKELRSLKEKHIGVVALGLWYSVSSKSMGSDSIDCCLVTSTGSIESDPIDSVDSVLEQFKTEKSLSYAVKW